VFDESEKEGWELMHTHKCIEFIPPSHIVCVCVCVCES
jgi:hypothetical protein